MAAIDMKGRLEDAVANDPLAQLRMEVPKDGRDYIVAYRLAGTFTGTIQVQDDQSGSFAAIASTAVASSGATAAHPTAVGNFAAAVTSGAEMARFVFSAYTSGRVEIEAVMHPVSA